MEYIKIYLALKLQANQRKLETNMVLIMNEIRNCVTELKINIRTSQHDYVIII
jgi:hypothetical protein